MKILYYTVKSGQALFKSTSVYQNKETERRIRHNQGPSQTKLMDRKCSKFNSS